MGTCIIISELCFSLCDTVDAIIMLVIVLRALKETGATDVKCCCMSFQTLTNCCCHLPLGVWPVIRTDGVVLSPGSFAPRSEELSSCLSIHDLFRQYAGWWASHTLTNLHSDSPWAHRHTVPWIISEFSWEIWGYVIQRIRLCYINLKWANK